MGNALTGYGSTCGKCGARRIDNQIGLEPTVDAYVAKLVDVFREVRRVLHPSGVVWLNLGDTYANFNHAPGGTGLQSRKAMVGIEPHSGTIPANCKPKDLIGIPWMVAFALRADGWYLRSEIIWHKRAPMPESVTDRPTKAHEQVFLLAKNTSYYYDHIAIAEPAIHAGKVVTLGEKSLSKGSANGIGITPSGNGNADSVTVANNRNKRSVWTLGPESFAGSHFAVMPTKLVEPCILAGTSAYGACSKCLAPWARVVEEERTNYKTSHYANTAANGAIAGGVGKNFPDTKRTTTGWQPTCTCNADIVPCTVLDCFNGAATTGIVAIKHGRKYIGIDLNSEYIEMSRKRLEQVQPLLFALEA